jgi:hypothetical protein
MMRGKYPLNKEKKSMKKIVWKDILEPRYALVVTLVDMPHVELRKLATGEFAPHIVQVPCVQHLPFKRPLDMPSCKFYTSLRERFGFQSMLIVGSYRTLRRLDNCIGSCSKENMASAVLWNG